MKIIKLIGATALLSSMFATSAYAQSADDDWSGVYVGGTFGLGVQNNDGNETLTFDTNRDGNFGDTVNTSGAVNAFSPGFCGGAATGTAPVNCTNDKDGLEYSVRVGFDRQSGSIVYGVVLDAQKSESTDSVSGFSTTPASYTMTRKLDHAFGARLRAGYAPGGILFYATGGATYAKIDHSFTTSNTANSFTSDDDDYKWGYTAGGGAEVKLSRNLSFGLEYLYSNYSDSDYTVAVGPGTAPATNPFLIVNPAGTDIQRSDDRFKIHSLRATASFRF